MSVIHKFTMPKWGLSMTEGKVTKWLVEEGVEVQSGAGIVDIETEKISSVAEAPESGVLRRRVAGEDEIVPVSGLLAVIAEASVPESEIDAFVEDFQAHFVPEEAADEAEGPATQKIEVAGRRIRYLEKGEGGQPALLIHGFGGDLNNWLFNHDALAQRRAVYALDLPGHGESSKEVGEGSLGELAEALHGFLDAVELISVHLIGHSLGGAVAIEFALAHPDRTSSITLISSVGLGPEIDAGYIEGFIESTRRKEIKPHLEKLFADPSLVSRQLVDDVLKFKRLDGVDGALRTIAGSFLREGEQAVVLKDRLGDLKAPLLVIWGAEDRIVPVSHAEGLPVQAEIIEKAGHMVQMEAAAKVNALIDEFLG